MFENYTIPFEFENVYHGFAVSKGLMIIDDDNLVFEFQTSDNFINLIKSDVKNIKVNYLQIGNIVFKKNIFAAKIIIQINSLKILSHFPNSPSELVLKIKRDNRIRAKEYVNTITNKINEKKLEHLENL